VIKRRTRSIFDNWGTVAASFDNAGNFCWEKLRLKIHSRIFRKWNNRLNKTGIPLTKIKYSNAVHERLVFLNEKKDILHNIERVGATKTENFSVLNYRCLKRCLYLFFFMKQIKLRHKIHVHFVGLIKENNLDYKCRE
jgi:hypothetical protein